MSSNRRDIMDIAVIELRDLFSAVGIGNVRSCLQSSIDWDTVP